MVQRAITVGGSGSQTISIKPDTSRLLYNIQSHNETWTATEDCVMVGSLKGSSGNATVFIGTTESNANVLIESTGEIKIGSSDNYAQSNWGIFIPKDTVVHTKNSSGKTYNLYFYPVSTS